MEYAEIRLLFSNPQETTQYVLKMIIDYKWATSISTEWGLKANDDDIYRDSFHDENRAH